MNNPLMISAVFTAFGVALFASWWIKRKVDELIADEKARSRTPFGEKLLRPAGEGLRLKIEALQEEVFEVVMLMTVYVVSPIFGALLMANKLSWFSLGVWVITSGLAYWLAHGQWKKLLELRQQRRNLRLGFDGERYMGEKLTMLVAMGYRVFHDLEVDWLPGKRFNIDHVVVGSNGVFVIETKARRKKMPDGSDSHVLKVAGGMIHLPAVQATDAPLAQARNNAEILAKWLTGSSGRKIPVFPVIAFPGWWVKEQEKCDVRVVSGNGIEKWLPHFGEADICTQSEVTRIADMIDKQCRNLEGEA